MRDWLIRLLGGVPTSTWNSLLAEVALLRGAYKDEIDWLRNSFNDEQKRVKELQDIIFTRFGVTIPVQQIQARGDQKPIELSHESWPRKKARLEREDIKQHLDRLEQEYKSKPGTVEMPPGDSPSSNGEPNLHGSSAMGD